MMWRARGRRSEGRSGDRREEVAPLGGTLEGWPGVESPGYFVSGVNPHQGGNVVHVARPPAAHESSAAAVGGSEKRRKKTSGERERKKGVEGWGIQTGWCRP